MQSYRYYQYTSVSTTWDLYMQLSGGLGEGLEEATSIFLKLKLLQKGSLLMSSL